MDLDSIEGLNEVRPAVYRAALKLRSLQKLCHMHVVTLRELLPALRSLSGAGDPHAGLTEEEVMLCINRMFQSVSQELPGQVASEAPEQTCRLLYRLYDREQAGSVSRRAVEAALIVLSADTLSAKHQALVGLAERCSRRDSGSVSRSGLRALLQDLSQVPAVVQESHVFGSVETAVRACFSGVLSPCVSEDHVIFWLQSEPCLLLWLSTLYRLSVSENVTHSVRCHACKAYPITGLRYRCMKCVNLHLCQTCFLTERHTTKHKSSHPVLEHCTQPSWRESLASFAYSARHALLPRRYSRREAQRRSLLRVLSRREESTSVASPDSSPLRSAAPPVCDEPVSSDGPPHPRAHTPLPVPNLPCPSPPSLAVRLESKALQTEEEEEPAQPQRRASVLLKDVRDLQRDKWLLERELQVWRAVVQSEQGSLEDRCTEMEANMATLKQHNLRLQDMLTQALSVTETPQHAHETHTPERGGASPAQSWSSGTRSLPGGGEREEEEGRREEEEEDIDERERDEERESESVRGDETETEEREEEDAEGEERDEAGTVTEAHSPTIPSGAMPNPHQSPAGHLGEAESTGDGHRANPLGERRFLEEQHSGIRGSVEEQLCDVMQHLKSVLSLPTGTVCRTEARLLKAAEEVGDSVSRLVAAVSVNTHTLRQASSRHPHLELDCNYA